MSSASLRIIRSLVATLVLMSPLLASAQDDPDGPETEASEGPDVADAGITDAAVDGDAATNAGPVQPSGPQISLTTPRDTVRSFLVTMQVAAHDRPELIDNALQCLDVTWLEDEADGEQRGRRLAAQLFEVLDALGTDLDEIPTESRRPRVVLRSFTPAEEDGPPLTITLERSDDEWRFSRSTLADLTEIEEVLRAEADHREDDTEQVVHAALRSPRAVMETFLDAMGDEPPDLERAAECLHPPEGTGAAWPVLKHDYAYQLYAVLLRARAPVLSTIPDPPRGSTFTWFVHGRGRIVIEQAREDDTDQGIWRGEWRFSQSTMVTIGALYAQYVSEPLLPEVQELGLVEHLSHGLEIERRIPARLQQVAFGMELWKWVGSFFLLVLGGVVFWFGNWNARLIFAFARRVWKLGSDGNDRSEERMAGAFGYLVMFYTLFRVIEANTLLLPAAPLSVIYPLSTSLIAGSVALFSLRIVELAEEHYRHSARSHRAHGAQLVIPLLKSFFRLAITAVAAGFILKLLGFSQSAVIGSLGILGAAIGFAARESIANTVAALSIVYDRPFRVGDWINFEGTDATVEHLGLVSVRMRTFYNSLVIVPNAQIITKTVDNYGERRYRRLRHFIRLRYDTPAAKIDALCEGLRELTRLHPYTRKDYFHIYLNELTPSSANVLLYIFFEVPDWATELRERHRFLVDALALVEDLGIELAYPTQRLLIEEVEGKESQSDGEDDDSLSDPEREGRRRAERLFRATYGSSSRPPRPVVAQSGSLIAGMADGGQAGGDGGGGEGGEA